MIFVYRIGYMRKTIMDADGYHRRFDRPDHAYEIHRSIHCCTHHHVHDDVFVEKHSSTTRRAPVGRHRDCMRRIFFLWPWFWINPAANITHFFRLQFIHSAPTVWFMGKLYESTPWYYPFVIGMIATPLSILIPFFFGAYGTIRKGTREERFLLVNAFFPFLILIPDGAKKYDGIRQMLPAYPFIVLVAAIGLRSFIEHMKLFRKTATVIVTLIMLATVYQGIIRIHPYQASYYNELVGGIAGAKRMGFETDYWASPYLGILPWMNQHKMSTFCVCPTTNPFYYYLAMGYLESGVVFDAAPETCDYLIVLMRQGYIYQYPNVVKLMNQNPYEYAVSIDSVPLVAAYAVPKGSMDLFSRDKQE